jgi:hypothetical protein
LQGAYIYGDYCSGQMWTLRESGGAWNRAPLMDSRLSLSSFGEDEAGELYAVDLGGRVMRFAGPGGTPAPAPASGGATFVLGFAQLKSALGDVMGSPIENEHGNPDNCDTQQTTTTGLAYWRCSNNLLTFAALPDGLHHWALVDGRVVEWTGASPEPP